MLNPRSQHGFTLIEAILTLLIMSIMATAMSTFIVGPVTGYINAAQVSSTVDDGARILQNVSRDLRGAVPNTLRVKASPGQYPAIEFVPVLAALTYRAAGGNNLAFDQAVSEFDVIGDYSSQLSAAQVAGDALGMVIFQQNAYTSGNYDQPMAGLNIYNAATSAGPYPAAGTHVALPASNNLTVGQTSVAKFSAGWSGNIPEATSITLTAPFQFAFDSPQQKAFIFDRTASPVTYLCDLNQGTLTRYWGYSFSVVEPNSSTSAPLSGANNAVVANNVASCSFTYAPGVSYRAARINQR